MESGLKMEEWGDGHVKVKSITLPFNDNDTGMIFHDRDALKRFFEEECQRWEWLKDKNNYPTYSKYLYDRVYLLFLQPIFELIKQWHSDDEQTIQSNIERICLHLEYVDFPYHCRNIRGLIEKQPTEIAINLVYLLMSGRLDRELDLHNTIVKGVSPALKNGMHSDHTWQQFHQLEPYRYRAAVILENYYQYGESSGKDYLAKRIQELEDINEQGRMKGKELADYIEDLDKTMTDWSSRFINENRNKINEARLRSDNFARRIARDLLRKSSDFRKDVDAKYEESLQVVEQAKDTYLSQVELDASVQYWKTKGETHKRSKNSWIGGLFALVAMIAVTPYLLHGRFSSADVVASLPEGASDAADMAINASGTAVGVLNSLGTNPLELVSTILAISAISYLIKFFAKQYSTQQHLYLEAEERKVMLMTYLALMNENKLKEQEDRKIALDTLFRPAQTGIFNDASHHVVPSDTIVKIFERQSSKPN
ncbi:DUF6161 domain-containing protein [Marinomonas fungiae]|uniref:DUF6161 domain-containing protein n=1 Tax=Marinomonas fungiae TaxID=1137284 RepID=UPI003A91AE7C